MACKHCHKPKTVVRTVRADGREVSRQITGPLIYPDLPLCEKCMTQHHGACSHFPRDDFKPGTRLGNLQGHAEMDWLRANGMLHPR